MNSLKDFFFSNRELLEEDLSLGSNDVNPIPE